MDKLNELLKGFRGLVTVGAALLASTSEEVRHAVQGTMDLVGPQISDGGAVATLVSVAISVKLLWTDAWKRIRDGLNSVGELKK